MPPDRPLPRGKVGHALRNYGLEGGALNEVLDAIPFRPPTQETRALPSLLPCTGGEPVEHHPKISQHHGLGANQKRDTDVLESMAGHFLKALGIHLLIRL
jgi:hypothetical protein